MASNQSTILGEINNLIANTIIGTDRPERRPEPGHIVVGRANDYLKKLYVLMRRLDVEFAPIKMQMEMIQNDVFGVIGNDRGITIKGLFDVATDSRIPALAKRFGELEDEFVPKAAIAKLVSSLFYAECKRAFPKLEDKKIEIDSNWDLSYYPPLRERGRAIFFCLKNSFISPLQGGEFAPSSYL